MQKFYEDEKEQMANFILIGRMRKSYTPITCTFIKSTEEGILSLIRNNDNWLSLSVYKVPTEGALYDFDTDELSEFRRKYKEEKQRETDYAEYCRLRKIFE
jgi:hypothetical protein